MYLRETSISFIIPVTVRYVQRSWAQNTTFQKIQHFSFLKCCIFGNVVVFSEILLCFLKSVFWKVIMFSERMLCFDLQGHHSYRWWASHGAQLLSGNLLLAQTGRGDQTCEKTSKTKGLSKALQYQQTECRERERGEQWGLIRSRDSSDIFISSNTLSHREPWWSPVCSMTGCSQWGNTALVEMFKSFIKQFCHCYVM